VPPEISLRQFVHVANQADGTIRISRDQSKIVNKGTLGQWFANVISYIGKELGLGDGNRRQRQNDTVKSFRASLAAHYGIDVANKALEDTGRAHGNKEVRLTGATVREINGRALQAQKQNHTDNQLMRTQAEIGEGGGIYEALLRDKELVEKGLERNMRPEFVLEYHARLAQRCDFAGDFGRKALKMEDVEAIARQEMSRLLSLEGNGLLKEVAGHRENFEVALTQLSSLLIKPGTRQEVAETMERASQMLDLHLKAEGKGSLPQAERQKLMENMLAADMMRRVRKDQDEIDNLPSQELKRRLDNEDPPRNATSMRLNQMQGGALSPKSGLRVLYREAEKSGADNITSMIRATVGALGRTLGARGVSIENDIGRFTGKPTVTPPPMPEPEVSKQESLDRRQALEEEYGDNADLHDDLFGEHTSFGKLDRDRSGVEISDGGLPPLKHDDK
jgi:hypothetical protein